ncbi:hypothetical protein BKN67_24135 [Salmonella enterica]|nr:hypothetical protein [Salmonella enterica]
MAIICIWTAPTLVDKFFPHGEAFSKASGLAPPRWLWRRVGKSTTDNITSKTCINRYKMGIVLIHARSRKKYTRHDGEPRT